jgi:hypothetical protein
MVFLFGWPDLIQTLGNVARVKKSAQNYSPSARDLARIS